MTFKRKSGGAWVDAANIKRRSGGAWVGAQTIKRRVSGAWVTVWSAVSFALTNHTISGGPAVEENAFPPPANFYSPGYATFLLNSNGTAGWATANDNGAFTGTLVTASGNYSGEWLTGGVASDYEVQVVVTSGTVTGSTTGAGVWNNLGTNRSWTHASALAASSSRVLTVTIRRVSDSVVVATATITLTSN